MREWIQGQVEDVHDREKVLRDRQQYMDIYVVLKKQPAHVKNSQ